MSKTTMQKMSNFFEAQKILKEKNCSKAIEFTKQNPNYEDKMIEMVLTQAKNNHDGYFLVDVGQNFPKFTESAEKIILDLKSYSDCLKWIECCKVSNFDEHLKVLTETIYKNKREKFSSYLKLLNINEQRGLKLKTQSFEDECIKIANAESSNLLTGPLGSGIFGSKELKLFVLTYPNKQFSIKIINEFFMPKLCLKELKKILTTNKELVDTDFLVENELTLFDNVNQQNEKFFDLRFATQFKDFVNYFKDVLSDSQKVQLSEVALNMDSSKVNFVGIVDNLGVKNFDLKKLENKALETQNVSLCLRVGCFKEADAEKLGKIILFKGNFDENYLFAKNCEKANKTLHLNQMKKLHQIPDLEQVNFVVNSGEISSFIQRSDHMTRNLYDESSSDVSENDAKQIILQRRAKKARDNARKEFERFEKENKKINEVEELIRAENIERTL